MHDPRQHPHWHPDHASMDPLTGSLAAGALVCLMILGGCGPQNGEPVQSTLAKARTVVPERAAAAVQVVTAAATVRAAASSVTR